MTTEDIFAFRAIAEYNSVSKAADALFITQSTLSQRLKALENELGVVLFNRRKGGKQFQMTEEGRRFARQAEKWAALYDETRAAIDRPVLPTLSIGCAISVVTSVLQYVIFDFLRKQEEQGNRIFPLVKSTIYSETYALLERGDLDFGFGSMLMASKSIVATPVFKEPLVFVCSKGSSYPAKVDANTLLTTNEVYIGKPGKAWYTPQATEWHKRQFKNQPTPSVSTISYPNLPLYFVRPDTWAIIPYSVAYPSLESGAIEMRESDDIPSFRTVYSLHNRDIPLSPLYDPLIEEIRGFVAKHPERRFEMV